MKIKRILSIIFFILQVSAGNIFAADVLSFKKEAFLAVAGKEKVVELSLKDCIVLCLTNNSEIKIKRIDPHIAESKILKAVGVYEPTLKSNLLYDETNTPAIWPALTGTLADQSRQKDFNLGVEGKTFTNTKYDINWYNSASSSNSQLQRFFPDFETAFGGAITQPVMKDFLGMAKDQADIVIAKNNKLSSDFRVINEAINVVSRVESVYYDYLNHIGQYKVGVLSLDSAKNLLYIVKARYDKGIASSVDLYEAEAGVAAREERLLYFERLVKKAEDDLKFITNLVDDPELWNATLYPKDRPSYEEKKVDLVASINEAFDSRMDYKIAKIDLKNRDIDIKVAKNSLLPTIDLVGTYEANGLGDKYSTAIDQVADGTFGSWSMGIAVRVPFGFTKEISDLRISRDEREKVLIALARLEQDIILEVRDAARNVDIYGRAVAAAKKTLDAEEKTFNAAMARFSAGLLSTHDMFDYQEYLDTDSLKYLATVVEYNKALIELERTKGTTLDINNIIVES